MITRLSSRLSIRSGSDCSRHCFTGQNIRGYATSETWKSPGARKTLLVQEYTKLLRTSPVVLVAHNGTLLKTENESLRAQLKKVGAKLTVTRSALFRVALRGLSHEEPASIEARKLHRYSNHPLMAYFKGPSAVITLAEMDPRKTEEVVKIVDKMGEKLLLLGALIDGDTMDRAMVDEFKKLPTLEELRANLVGVLTVLGGAGLVQTLQSSSNMLYLMLNSRKEVMESGKESA